GPGPRQHATPPPDDPTTQRPNDPTTQRPNDLTTQRPNDPSTQRPNDPSTQRPIDPSTASGASTMGNPEKQGLYDPGHEHDACGVGFLVHLKGEPSHRIIRDAIVALNNLNHRGACGCEVNLGDG